MLRSSAGLSLDRGQIPLQRHHAGVLAGPEEMGFDILLVDGNVEVAPCSQSRTTGRGLLFGAIGSTVHLGEAAWLDFHAWQLVEGGKLSLRLPTDGSTASAAIDSSPGG
jgi:hypothetical protein